MLGHGLPLDEASSDEPLTGPQALDLKDGRDFDRHASAEASNIDDRTKIFFMEVW